MVRAAGFEPATTRCFYWGFSIFVSLVTAWGHNRMMKTVTIQTGNTDNKLTQQEWSILVKLLADQIRSYAKEIHFFGGAESWAMWQNAAWVILIEQPQLDMLKAKVIEVREMCKQDSVAWTEGKTLFV
jgi:hypothetical protein